MKNLNFNKNYNPDVEAIKYLEQCEENLSAFGSDASVYSYPSKVNEDIFKKINKITNILNSISNDIINNAKNITSSLVKNNVITDNLILIKFEYNALSVYEKLQSAINENNVNQAKMYANDLKEILLMLDNSKHRLGNISIMQETIKIVEKSNNFYNITDNSISR